MERINDQQLLDLNKKGLFPGPKESEEDFLKRANQFLKSTSFLDQECLESLQKAKELYDISPHWVEIEYGNLGLRFWEAAQVETTSKYFRFQLRKSFLKQPKYLGLYCKQEILTHEFSHVGRMAFPPSKYEEFFAFQSSSSLRKHIGPLFSSPNESFALVVLTTLSFLSDFLLRQSPYAFLFFKGLPLMYLGFLGLRLLHFRRHFSKALAKLTELVQNKDPKKAQYVMYRLTEKEILQFSKSKLKAIEEYAQSQKELRWRLIQIAYLNSAA